MSEELIPKAAWIAWGIVGAAYAGFWIWLAVRLVNRRKPWMIRAASALAISPLLYGLSSGPISIVAFHSRVMHRPVVMPDGTTPVMATSELSLGRWFPIVYAPLLLASEKAGNDWVFQYWMLFPHHETMAEP
jgi:hypothetical protein